jgi:PAS domain S-box-containing protein
VLEEAANDLSFALDVIRGERMRRDAEAAVSRSESRLRFLLSANPAVIYSLKPEGAYDTLFISANVKAVLGYESSDFMSDASFWQRQVHPDDLAGAFEGFAKLRESGHAAREYRFRHLDGNYRWMRDEVRAVRDAGGTVLEYVGYWLDITESRMLAEQLSREEARFRFIFEHAPVGISLTGADRKLIVNPEHVRITGVPESESSKPGAFAKASHPDDYARQMKAAEGYIKGEQEQYSVEKRYIHANGRVVWARLTSRFYVDPTSGEKHSVTIISDITETRATEEALRTREAIFSSIVGQALDSIVLIDPKSGRFVEFNEAAHRNLGYSREEFSTLTLFDISVSETERQIRRGFEQLGSAGGAVIDVRHRARNGEIRDVRVSVKAITLGGRSYLAAVWSDLTERLRVEKDLRKLSLVVEQSPASIVITDLTGMIEYVNPAFEALTGYAKEEVLGRNPRILQSGETPPEVFVEMWKVLGAGKVWRGELHNRKKSGETFVELAVLAPLFGPDGKASHYVAIKEDVTGRKQAEFEQRRLVKKLQALHAVAITMDRTDMSDSDLLGVIESQMQSAMRDSERGRVTVAVGEVVRASGVQGDIATEFSVPVVVNGIQVGAIRAGYVDGPGWTHARELTEQEKTAIEGMAHTVGVGLSARRLLEEVRRFNVELEEKVAARTRELAERNTELQGVLSAIPDMVMLMGSDGKMLKCQPARGSPGLAPLGCSADEAGLCVIADDLREACLKAGLRAIAEGGTVSIEAELKRPEGVLQVEIRAAPAARLEFVVFVRDIGERKRREAETAEMLEREHQISEMKTRFISVTSHEFRTPMAAVLGSAELLQNHFERLSLEKRSELFGRIKHSLGRMTEMLDEVLTLNRMDAGRTAVHLDRIDLGRLARGIVEEIHLGDHDAHRFSFEAEGAVADVPMDSALFHQIFSNLLSNAVRYSPPGSLVSVRIAGEAARLVLTVEDQGIGIPEEDVQRIFEPFERGSNVGNIKGTGLGLNIFKRVAELLGGRLSVQSALGKGSTFRVEFPLHTPSP